MEKELPLYQMIYNKLVNRILLGLYPKGYQLASVEKIHDRYDVGYTSIRRALHLLHQEGFIRLEERRRPVVVFDAEEPQGQALRRRVFLSRRQAHLDCYRALPCLIPGLTALGAKRCEPWILETLEALCAPAAESLSTRGDLLVLTYAWLALVVRQADNDLANDLFMQIHGFDDLRMILLPGPALRPGEAEACLLSLRHWTDLLRRGQWEDLHTLVTVFCWQALGDLERDFAALEEEARAVRPVAFCWYVRQAQMPLYQKIAWDLLRTAYLEGMEPGTCFPSEAALMKRYGVSAVTVRGALSVLNALGAAQTVNGVGTLLTAGSAGEADAACLRESRESLEILAGCAYALAAAAGPRLSEEEREALPAGAAYQDSGGAVLWLLRQLAAAIRSQALENVLEQLEVRLILGLYVRGLPGRPERREQGQAITRRVSVCLSLLEAGETDAFAAALGQLCREAGEELGKELR